MRYPIPFLLFLLGLVFGSPAFSQTAPDTWWVQFTDKDNSPYSLSDPSAYLSERAILRRQAQNIPLDELDLPVDPAYISAVLSLGSIQLINRSKWFNAITIRTTDSEVLSVIESLPFVQSMRSTHSHALDRPMEDKFGLVGEGLVRGGGGGAYGASFAQIAMLNGHLLHDLDARGQGMLIGVLDAGFEGTDVLDAFQSLRDRDGIWLTRDLVEQDADVYQDHWHGRSVLSCLAGLLDGVLIGTAPQADYVLLRTEDAATEFVVEEDNWVSGAELCDSLGVDVINTSLGYTVFDWTEQDHSYLDMDGATSRISIACGIASSKGMIPVVSAGNSGESDWFHISAPADAINILAVGAVGDEGQLAPFSSRGPSADGRVKPDVAAMGWGTIGLGADGIEVTAINGTSFAAPLVSGLVACLWQLHPERTAHDVMDAVRRSASQYAMPDDELGHGIPDLMMAHRILELTTGMPPAAVRSLAAFPMPFNDRLELRVPHGFRGPVHVVLFDVNGRARWSKVLDGQGQMLLLEGAGLASLADGVYVLRVQGVDAVLSRTVVKAH